MYTFELTNNYQESGKYTLDSTISISTLLSHSIQPKNRPIAEVVFYNDNIHTRYKSMDVPIQ